MCYINGNDFKIHFKKKKKGGQERTGRQAAQAVLIYLRRKSGARRQVGPGAHVWCIGARSSTAGLCPARHRGPSDGHTLQRRPGSPSWLAVLDGPDINESTPPAPANQPRPAGSTPRLRSSRSGPDFRSGRGNIRALEIGVWSHTELRKANGIPLLLLRQRQAHRKCSYLP